MSASGNSHYTTIIPQWLLSAHIEPYETYVTFSSLSTHPTSIVDLLVCAEAGYILHRYSYARKLLEHLRINYHQIPCEEDSFVLLIESKLDLIEGRITDAIRCFETSLNKCPDQNLRSYHYWQWANILELLGNYPDALRFYNRALERVPPDDEILMTLIQCGIIRIETEIGDNAISIQYCQEHLDRLNSSLDWPRIYTILHYANALLKNNQIEHAYELLMHCPRSTTDTISSLIHDGLLVSIYRLSGKWEEAGAFADAVVQKSKNLQLPYHTALALYLYGSIFSDDQSPLYSPPLAIQYLKEALSLLEDLSFVFLVTVIHEEIAKVYRTIRHYQKSLYHLDIARRHREKTASNQSIVELKRWEIEIASTQLRKEVERQQSIVSELTHQIERSHQELEQYKAKLQEQMTYLGVVAHDLKNPIATILMSAAVMNRYYSKLTQNDFEKHTKAIMQTAEWMRDLVSSLLNFTALTTGRLKLNPEPVHASLIFDAVIETWRIRALSKSLTIHKCYDSSDIYALADSQRLAECLDNLLSNAIKYTPLGRNIYCSIEPLDGKVRFGIRDEGVGLSPEQQQQIFDEFTRIHTHTTTGEGGSGLGLSIVRRLVEAMNGRVYCESVWGNGSTFYIELPEVQLTKSNGQSIYKTGSHWRNFTSSDAQSS